MLREAPIGYAPRMSDHRNDKILVEHRDGCHVVRFLTETLFDPLEVAAVEKQIHELIAAEDTPKVVLAMETLGHLASATISTLISVRSACQGKGGDAALAGVPDPIMEILRVARLDTVFRIYPNTAEAVIALNG